MCAMDRAAMLVGAPAAIDCFQVPATIDFVLPGDLDGTTLPPAGSPASTSRRLEASTGLRASLTSSSTTASNPPDLTSHTGPSPAQRTALFC
jgi:hypothetical protein